MINDKGVLNHSTESKKLITEARHDGQLVIFVGAGAYICSGMPTWGQAVKEIAAHLGIYDESLDFLSIPQYKSGSSYRTGDCGDVFQYSGSCDIL